MGVKMKKIVVFASGRGSNFSAIVDAVKRRKLAVHVALLICDNPQAGVLERAHKAGVPVALIERSNFASKKEFEAKMIECVDACGADLLVLAGFMILFSADFVSRYRGKIINIHPSLLPAFKGTHAIHDAFIYGAQVTGVTVHFVDEELDHGPIILQGSVEVRAKDTEDSLEKRIHALEHTLYPQAIKLFCAGKLAVQGRVVRINP